jgi:hypothetical protein
MTTEIDAALIALGFIGHADGTLRVPSGATVTLAPTGSFYELRIDLRAGAAVTAIMAKNGAEDRSHMTARKTVLAVLVDVSAGGTLNHLISLACVAVLAASHGGGAS